MFGGQIHPNNSIFFMTDIGEDDDALSCVTDWESCCQASQQGEWYYPDNKKVLSSSAGLDFYQKRGSQAIHLNRRSAAIRPTGKYRCRIPDSSGTFQTLIAYIIGK